MKHFSLLTGIFMLIFLPLSAGAIPSFYDKTDHPLLIKKIVSEMDDTELLGQVFMLGFFGTKPSESILSWISNKNIGGVKLFGWNVSSLTTLGKTVGQLQRKAAGTKFKIPLFIATDQEGGWVRHIKGATSITPGNLSIGATGLPYDAYMTGLYIGKEMRTLGINMNFAPTVDVYTNPEADVIGPRSFSHDPLETAELSVAFYKGQNTSGVISTAKHFPGHGDATQDSHGTLPVMNTDFKTLWSRELLPYRFLIKRGIPAIMTGHLAFPHITGKIQPASLSYYFLHDILRKKMGFKGILITDDMRMTGAIFETGDTPTSCLDALEAGNNMIMVSHDTAMYQRIWEKLYHEIQTNPSFKEIIRSSVKRILSVKLQFLTGTSPVPIYPDSTAIKQNIPAPHAENFFFNQACRAVSVIKSKHLPLNPKKIGKVLLTGPYPLFLSTGKHYFPHADTYYFPFSPKGKSMKRYSRELSAKAGNYNTIIFSLANKNGAEVLNVLKNKNVTVIVVSSLTPVYVKDMPWLTDVIAVYGTGIESFIAGFSSLLGSFTPDGKVPIPLTSGWTANE
ncbi:MAG: glycoside hydrolase family 3 protein [Desulfobacula sp.]|nr:glycoside hydrolase family 3 protein [Desulfobacula sp.]